MSVILDAAKTYLTTKKYTFKQEDSKTIRVELVYTDNGQRKLTFQTISGTSSSFAIRSSNPQRISTSKMLEGIKIANKLNSNTAIGMWHVDKRDGELLFKISFSLVGYKEESYVNLFERVHTLNLQSFVNGISSFKNVLSSSVIHSNQNMNVTTEASNTIVDLKELYDYLCEQGIPNEEIGGQKNGLDFSTMPTNIKGQLEEFILEKDAITITMESIACGNQTADFNLKPKVLGKGAFGTVFEGKLWNQINVAVKEVALSGKEDINVLVKEAKVMTSLRHQNILEFYGVSLLNGKIVLVTELCESDLLQYLERKKVAVSHLELVEKLLQIASGVNYLHLKKLYHRDLKPGNLLVTSEGTVKVADFGLSVKDRDKLLADLGGTPLYMAPEAFEGKVSAAVDVYAFGIIVWELFHFGKPAYKNLTSLEHLMQIVREGKRPDIDESCPREIKELITSCVQGNPSNRPDFASIIAILKNIMEKLKGQKFTGTVTFTRQAVIAPSTQAQSSANSTSTNQIFSIVECNSIKKRVKHNSSMSNLLSNIKLQFQLSDDDVTSLISPVDNTVITSDQDLENYGPTDTIVVEIKKNRK